MSQPARVIPLDRGARVRQSGASSLSDYTRWWFENSAGDIDPSSRRTYRAMMDHFVADIGDLPIGEITAADLQPTIARLLAMGRKASTVTTARSAVAKVLGTAARHRLIPHNPAEGLVVPAPEAVHRTVLSIGETARLVKHLSEARPWEPINALLILYLQTGLRLAEGSGVRLVDFVDLFGPAPRLRVTVQAVRLGRDEFGWADPKSPQSRGRLVGLQPETVAAIRRRMDLHPEPVGAEAFLLGPKPDRPYHKGTINTHLRRACKAAGVPVINVRQARTSFMTNASAAGVPLADLAAIAGNRKTTLVSYYLQPGSETAFETLRAMFDRARESTENV